MINEKMLKCKNCAKCKNAQLYKSYYDGYLTISCNEKITDKIMNLPINDLKLLCGKYRDKCLYYEYGKPNENIIVSYDD